MMLDKKNKSSVYSKFINDLQYKQKYKDKWNTTLSVNLSDQEWKMINILPFRITKDTLLRWLQYRIIHRCIATNDILSKFNLVESSVCTFCSEQTETINHLFFQSIYADFFWKELELWLLQNFNIELAFENKDICLCKKMNNNYVIMNLIIILAKKHIYRQRLEKKKPRLDIFLTELRYYFEVEKAIYQNQRKYSDFRSGWKVIISWFE